MNLPEGAAESDGLDGCVAALGMAAQFLTATVAVALPPREATTLIAVFTGIDGLMTCSVHVPAALTATVPTKVPEPTTVPVRMVTMLAPGKLAVPAARHSALLMRYCGVAAVIVTEPGRAVTVTVAVEVRVWLVTVTLKVSVWNSAGMVNDGRAVVAPVNATVGPVS